MTASSVLVFMAATLVKLAESHGQLTVPRVRPDSQGYFESFEHRRPAFTSKLGNVFGATETAYRCHDFQPEPGAPKTTLKAGTSFDATWKMEAGHPGDCYFYLSYDADAANAANFFKIWAVPGCGASDGLTIPDVVTKSVALPKDLPPCEHCVLRWEWTAHQQVSNIEYYVSCADVRIESAAPPSRPEPMVAIAGFEHLPESPSDYRQAYGGEGAEAKYLVGPAIASFSPCELGSPGCIGDAGGGGNGSAASAPSGTPSAAAPTTPSPATAAPSPTGRRGTCTCTRSTPWDGSFAAFANEKNFCSQDFGSSGAYISAGGGSGSSGAWSGLEPCSSSQYSFSEEDGWQIKVSGEQARGKSPYRAFAYLQLCNGNPYSQCLDSGPMSLSFSFKTDGAESIGAFVKLLFWTDAGNIVGLLPPWHEKGDGRLRLVSFMKDDFPNEWSHEVEVQDNTWYHLRLDFAPSDEGSSSTSISLWLDGAKLADGTIPVDVTEASNGPQLGVYSFDLSEREWPYEGLTLWLDDACLGTTAGTCPSGSGVVEAESAPTPTPADEEEPTASPGRSDGSATTTPGGSDEAGEEPAPTPSEADGEEPEPTPAGPRCSPLYEQCGGASWDGPTCCEAGSCVVLNPWYSHCNVESGSNPTAAPEPRPTPAAPEAGGRCAVLYAQCGGQGLEGPICCEAGSVCVERDAFYSQCVLDSGTGTPTAAPEASAVRSGRALETVAPSACAGAYGQCGGAGFAGATCCESGHACRDMNGYYSQCVPESQVVRTRRPADGARTRGFLSPDSALMQAHASLAKLGAPGLAGPEEAARAAEL